MNIFRSTPLPINRTAEIAILTALLVVAAGLRFYSIDTLPLWLDEAWTYYFSGQTLSNLLSTVIDIHPPLFYLIEKFALQFGDSELVLRFAPATFGVMAVFMVYLIGRSFAGPVCGLFAAAVLATSSLHIEYSQEARSYTFLFLEICIAAYGVLRFINDRESATKKSKADSALRLNALIMYLVGAVAAVYTHNISVFYLFALNFVVLLAWWPFKRINNKLLFHWVAAQALLLVLWWPWLAVLIDQAQGNEFSWLRHYPIGKAMQTVLDTFGFKHLPWFRPAADAIVLYLAAAGLLAASYGRRSAISILAGLFLIIVPSVMWAVGFIKPVFMARTMVVSMLGGVLGLGLVVNFAHRRIAAFVIVAFVLVGNIASTMNYYRMETKGRWNDVVSVISADHGRSDLVILCEYYTYLPFGYYQDRFGGSDFSVAGWYGRNSLIFEIEHGFAQRFILNRYRKFEVASDAGFSTRYGVEPIDDLAGSYRRIWLIKSHFCRLNSKGVTERIEGAGFVTRSEEQFKGGVTTVLFELP